MSNQKFRTEASRKNYVKQEKKRAQAARRKAIRAKVTAVTDKAKSWLKENKRLAVKITIAAVVVIVALWLVCKWFVGPGGSLPNFFGHVRGIEDSWVVTDLNPRTNANAGSSNVDSSSYGKTPRYFHLASLEPLKGYTQDPGFTIQADETNQDQHYINDDENAMVNSVYVFGVANKTAEKHAGDMVSTMSLSSVTSDIMTDTIAGFDVRYVYFVFDQEPDENGVVTEAYASLCLCIDTTEDACVLVILNTYDVPKDEVPTAEMMLPEAEIVLQHLTVY